MIDHVWQRPSVRYSTLGAVATYLVYLAITRPYTFGERNMTVALALIVVIYLTMSFETYFLPALLVVFFWAGSAVPFAGAMQFLRWAMVGLAAFLSLAYYARRAHRLPFNHLHLWGFLTVVAALVSASVSYNPKLTLMKASSVAGLFVYATIGIRAVWRERPDGMVRAVCWLAWILVYLTAALYFLFSIELWGNPNSMGLVIGVICWPVLLWLYLLAESSWQKLRAGLPLLLCAVLLLSSGSRASLLAAGAASVALLISARRYRLMIVGCFLFGMVLSATYVLAPQRFQARAERVIYKKGERFRGVLLSRQSPWEDSWASVQAHPWLGTGFGVSEVAVGWRGGYESSLDSRERGSSYLTILEGFGLLGGVPFVLLLGSLLFSCWRTFSWLRRGGKMTYPAVPVASLLVAGLVNAAFEDWLLAVGYHTCVVLWVVAFSLRDLMQQPANCEPSRASRPYEALRTRPEPLRV
jgi:O-antigen ligase